MKQLLDFLVEYSNLILVIITGVYAYLTYRMVLEMKKAREDQADANLIASPIPFGPLYAQIQLKNAGLGPALDVELIIAFEPQLQTIPKTWKYSAFSVNQIENFLLPQEESSGALETLRDAATKHNTVEIKLKWKNIFGRRKSFNASYNLNELAEGWYNAGHLIPPEDLPTQMKETAQTLDKIHRDLEHIRSELSRPQPDIQIKTKSKKTSTPRTKRSK
jgi:hypothetical protein